MNRALFLNGLGLVVATLVAGSAAAGENAYITLGAGNFEIADEDDSSVEYRVEYRHSNWWRELYPSIGINGNSDGAVYGFFGLNYDFYPGGGFVITPNLAVGVYEEGDSKELGGPLEFRSGIEVGYQFTNQSRLGLTLSHMSNASIYDHNPGCESLVLNYSMPLKWFAE